MMTFVDSYSATFRPGFAKGLDFTIFIDMHTPNGNVNSWSVGVVYICIGGIMVSFVTVGLRGFMESTTYYKILSNVHPENKHYPLLTREYEHWAPCTLQTQLKMAS